MPKHNEKKAIKILGIDLAKRSFHLYGVDNDGHKSLSKNFNRNKLKIFMVNLPPCSVAMEACGSAHYWARLFQSYGHEVKLIAPQFVKPYVKSNKNDAIDAEAITEAVQRPNMRFVAIKAVEQQDIQAIHRMRSLMVEQRTAKVNQIRGLLLEYGIEIPTGRTNVNRHLPDILEDADNHLSTPFRGELFLLYEDLKQFDERVKHYDQMVEQIALNDEQAIRLMTIPGIASKGATALLAAIGDIYAFKNGRELAAWLGLVPRQNSTGGHNTLLGISKRGDVYLRQLIIHGARSVINRVEGREDRNSQWAVNLKSRRPYNVAVVAMANKIVRIAFALLKTGQSYHHEQNLCDA